MWLLVEDEPDIYETFQALFELWGIDGVGFTSFNDAQAWIEEFDASVTNIPQLALLDIRLPDHRTGMMKEQGGLILARLIRQHPHLSQTVVVMMSAYVPRGNQAGDYLQMTEEGIMESGRVLTLNEVCHLNERALLKLVGADFFIPKPLPSPAEFRAILDSLVK